MTAEEDDTDRDVGMYHGRSPSANAKGSRNESPEHSQTWGPGDHPLAAGGRLFAELKRRGGSDNNLGLFVKSAERRFFVCMNYGEWK